MAKPQSSRGRQNERLTVASVEAQRQYKETQRRLAQLDAIFESTHALLALLDRDLNFVMVNSAYAESSGHSKGELIGRNHFALFPNAENQAIFERVRDTGEPYRAVEKPFEYADQPERGVTYWNWTLVPVKAEDGTVQELVFSLLDVTETVRARQRIEQLVDGLRRANEEREDFIRTISHDLRNPLTAIAGHAQLLRYLLSQKEMQREADSAQAIITSTKRMNSMIQDLVESTRLEAGKLEMRKEPTDLLQLLVSLVERAGTPEERARIKLQFSEWVPPVLADPERLERVVVNLITNALKYSPPDLPVTVRLERQNGEVVITVADRGKGIPVEEQPYLFERFYRARTGRRVEGLGLGLYIARLIVEAHQGRIWVKSEEGKGSTFYVALPVEKQG